MSPTLFKRAHRACVMRFSLPMSMLVINNPFFLQPNGRPRSASVNSRPNVRLQLLQQPTVQPQSNIKRRRFSSFGTACCINFTTSHSESDSDSSFEKRGNCTNNKPDNTSSTPLVAHSYDSLGKPQLNTTKRNTASSASMISVDYNSNYKICPQAPPRRRSPHLGAHVLPVRRSYDGTPHLNTSGCTTPKPAPSVSMFVTDPCHKVLNPASSTPRSAYSAPMKADHSISIVANTVPSTPIRSTITSCVSTATPNMCSNEFRKRPYPLLQTPLASTDAHLPKSPCLPQRVYTCSTTPSIVTNPLYRRRSVDPPLPLRTFNLDAEEIDDEDRSCYNSIVLSPPRASRLPPPPTPLAVMDWNPRVSPAAAVTCLVDESLNLSATEPAPLCSIALKCEKRRRSASRLLFNSLCSSVKRRAVQLRRAVSTERLVSQEEERLCFSSQCQPAWSSNCGTSVDADVALKQEVKKVTPSRKKSSTGPSFRRLAERLSVGGKENSTKRVAPSPNHLEFKAATTSPFFSAGQVLQFHEDGSRSLILHRAGPRSVFGFFVCVGNESFKNGIFVSRIASDMCHALRCLVGVGDEILELEGVSGRQLTLEKVHEIIGNLNTLKLRIIPHSTQ